MKAYFGDVRRFYEEELSKKGWRSFYAYAANSLEYTWQDEKSTLPYLVHLDFHFFQERVSEPATDTELYLRVWREPDPNNVPKLDDARDIETKDVIVTETVLGLSRRVKERWVSFLTGNSPDEVLSRYQTILPRYGWRVIDPSESSFSDGISYGYSASSYSGNGGPQGGATVNIVARPDTSGQVRVELRIRGNKLTK